MTTEQDEHEARIYASREARKLAALDPRDGQEDAIFTMLLIFRKNLAQSRADLAAANERIARLEGVAQAAQRYCDAEKHGEEAAVRGGLLGMLYIALDAGAPDNSRSGTGEAG